MKTVLIADDEPIVTITFKKLLEEAGCAVATANDGQTALDWALKNHPDLVICDWHMPPADGWLLEELRRDSWGKTVSVAVLTSDSSPEVIGPALQSKVVHILPKHLLKPSVIVEKVLQILNEGPAVAPKEDDEE